MCCTFGDKTDVEWYQKHGLDLRQAIGADGRMTDVAGPEAGMTISEARKAILARLEEAGHLLGKVTIENVVNTYERTGREIEFLPTRQWFVRVKPDHPARGGKPEFAAGQGGGVGLLVTMPVTAIAIAYAWRYFSGGRIAAPAA
jgi:valyl-tRNA synthetase